MRRVLLWLGQALLAAALIAFVGRSVVSNWAELRALDLRLHPRPTWIVLSAVVIWFTYGVLIEAWRRVLAGWGHPIAYSTAARIWCLSNLGRYLPGKLWGIAALAMLAQRARVPGWAAAASALAMQALAVGTGVVIVAIGAPSVMSPLQLAGAALAASAAVAVLAWEPLAKAMGRLVPSATQFRALPAGTAPLAAGITLLSWIGYGVAFWLLARGLFEASDLALTKAVGVFAAGYIVGLLALFAPGGVGVRELVFVALLAPAIGSGGALALSIGSRLLMTGTELGAVLGALALSRVKEKLGERSQ